MHIPLLFLSSLSLGQVNVDSLPPIEVPSGVTPYRGCCPDPPTPEYPGGMTKMYKDLYHNMTYPKEARAHHIQGKIFVEFTVDSVGFVRDANVLKGIGYGCDEMALQAVKKLGQWIPGINYKGHRVPCRLKIPIKFVLETADTLSIIDSSSEKSSPTNQAAADIWPEYPGGREALDKELYSYMVYPKMAKRAGIQGTIWIEYVVDSTGNTTNIKLLKGIGGGCDEQALKAMQRLEHCWLPGTDYQGIPKSIKFKRSLHFRLD